MLHMRIHGLILLAKNVEVSATNWTSGSGWSGHVVHRVIVVVVCLSSVMVPTSNSSADMPAIIAEEGSSWFVVSEKRRWCKPIREEDAADIAPPHLYSSMLLIPQNGVPLRESDSVVPKLCLFSQFANVGEVLGFCQIARCVLVPVGMLPKPVEVVIKLLNEIAGLRGMCLREAAS